jgi:hypothetical protein
LKNYGFLQQAHFGVRPSRRAQSQYRGVENTGFAENSQSGQKTSRIEFFNGILQFCNAPLSGNIAYERSAQIEA